MLQNLTLTWSDIICIIAIEGIILSMYNYFIFSTLKEKEAEIKSLRGKVQWCESVIIQKEFKQWQQEYILNPNTPKEKDVFYTKEADGYFQAYIIDEVSYDNLFYFERKLETIAFKKNNYKFPFEDLNHQYYHYHIKRYNKTIGDSYGSGGEKFLTKEELDVLLIHHELYVLKQQTGEIPQETPNDSE